MTRADLIAALEKAEGPSRELDAHIGALTCSLPECPAEWLANWKGPFAAFCWGAHGWRVAAMQDNGDRAVHWEPPHFTASINAALTLVPEGWRWNVSNRASSPHTGRAHVENRELHFIGMGGMTPNPKLRWYECTAATTAIAVCIAALKAGE